MSETHPIKGLDLAEATAVNRQAHAAALRGDAEAWDYVVLTASDERQARGYEVEIENRWQRGLLPAGMKVLVMADPEGARIGSGGATLLVARRLAEAICHDAQKHGTGPCSTDDLTEMFAHKRVLVIHSGGDSKRVPQHACFGKAFARVPVELENGDTSTLFDELLIAFSGLAARMDAGMVALSGDVLLTFDYRDLPHEPDGIIGVGFKADPSFGEGHGVYVTEPDRNHVRAFLQKVGEPDLAAAGAIDEQGRIAVDTGILVFAPQCVAMLAQLAGARLVDGQLKLDDGVLGRNCAEVSLHLYDEICGALATSADRQTYLDRPHEALDPVKGQAARETIWETLRGTPFYASVLESASFLHFGTTRQYRDELAKGHVPGYALVSVLNSHVSTEVKCGNAKVYDSTVVGDGSEIGEGALVEDCDLTGRIKIEPGAVLSSVAADVASLHVCSDVVLHQVVAVYPGQDEPVTTSLVFGVDDNPKATLASDATFLGQAFGEWLGARGIHPDEIWPGIDESERCLWNALLYPKQADEGLSLVLWMQEPEAPPAKTLAGWRVAERTSMQEAFKHADCERLCQRRLRRTDERMLLRLQTAVRTGDDTNTVKLVWQTGHFSTFQDAIRMLFAEMSDADPLMRARAWKVISDTVADGRYAVLWGRTLPAELPKGVGPSLLGEWRSSDDPIGKKALCALEAALKAGRLPDPTHRELVEFVRIATEDIAFEHVAEAIEQGTPVVDIRRDGRATPANQVTVSLPARLDFGGGWSDTPPYSQERGGKVLNVAIDLDGKPPIVATARRIDEPRAVLRSHDLEEEVCVEDLAGLSDYADPESSLSLHKAAMVLVSGRQEAQSLADLLEPFGGGIEVTTRCDVPKGSGLGTSSIVGLGLVACLRRMAGLECDQAQLSSDVLCLEQMLTTGGGWNDQLGGMVGGVKFITTEPGFEQRPTIEPVVLSPAVEQELTDRLVVHWTGIRRLAKRILKTIMGKWLSREPTVVRVLGEIQDIAVEMRGCLDKGDLDRVGQLMRHHWYLNKLMDPHTSYDYIEQLFTGIDDLMCGAKLAGAGGGGYMMIVAKDAQAAEAIRHKLTRLSRDTHGAVANATVNDVGLKVEAS